MDDRAGALRAWPAGQRASVRKIAVFRALFLGDFLCALPALRLLRRQFPNAEITLIGLPWTAEMLGRVGVIDRLLPFPGYPGIIEVPYEQARTAAFVEAARAEAYDLAIQMHGDGRNSNGFVADLGAAYAIGYARQPDARLSAALPHRLDDHEVLRWMRLVGTLAEPGAHPADDHRLALDSSFAVNDDERAKAAVALSSLEGAGPLIGLHAGAKDPNRRWPTERFAALADALAKRYGARIVLTGNADERALTEAIRRQATAPVLDVAGQTDLGGFAALLDGLDLLVTNDTGASHVAAAMGTRSVVLFGPSRPEHWAPLRAERHRPIDALLYAPDGTPPEGALAQLPLEPVLRACALQLAEKENQCAVSTF